MSERHPGEDRQTDAVGAAWRDASFERPPADLDARILATARQPRSATPVAAARRQRWLQPLAVAATLAISIAIVLEIVRIDERLDRQPSRPGPLPAAASGDEAATGAPPAVDADIAAELREAVESKRTPAATPAAAPAAGGRSDFADVPDEAGREPALRARTADASLNRELAAGADDDPCAVDNDDPENWLACIAGLDAAGDSRAAALQREQFAERFPAYGDGTDPVTDASADPSADDGARREADGVP